MTSKLQNSTSHEKEDGEVQRCAQGGDDEDVDDNDDGDGDNND